MTPNRRTITLTLAAFGLFVFSGQACPFFAAPFAPLEGSDPGDVVVEIILEPFIQAGVSTPLKVRAGIGQDDGTVDYSHTIDIELAVTNGTTNRPFGTTNADGFFESEITPNPGFESLTVFATATENLTLATATATATAQAIFLAPNSPITIELRDSHLFAEALAEAGTNNQLFDRPGLLHSDPDAYGTFNGELTATIAAQDPENFGGAASSTSTATQLSTLFTDSQGMLSGGTVRGTCTSSASISDDSAGNLYSETQAGSGLALRFTINGNQSYILTVNGTFTGTGQTGTGANSTGQYQIVGNGISSVANFNTSNDGGSLSVSDNVILPPGGPYRLEIGHGSDTVAIGFLGSNTAQTSMDFTFTFAPAE